jgi:DNA-binding LacI/PurR family transcriptional regulator
MSALICCTDARRQKDYSVMKRPKIAVFLNGISHFYQHAICEGITRQAEELDYSVLFFASNVSYIINENDEGELKLFTLPDIHGFDGIIVATNTITSEETIEYLRKTLPAGGVPIISIGPPVNGSFSVDSSDNGCMETLIRHFIVDHGFTHINFISGTPGNPDAKYRLNTYKRVLAEQGIEYDETVSSSEISTGNVRERLLPGFCRTITIYRRRSYAPMTTWRLAHMPN